MKVIKPKSPDEFERYYDLRWRILRAPCHQKRGSEKDEYEDQAFHLMAIDENDVLKGVGRLHFVEPKTAQIRFMAVDEGFRRQGAGKLILNQLEMEARLKSALKIFLHAREDAAGFYLKMGYVVTGPGPILFGSIRHWVMEKLLV